MPRKKQTPAKSFTVDLGTTPEGTAVELDVGTMINSRVLVCANSGGGKSYLLRKLIELVAVQVPTLVIDPDGEFSTLRELIDLVLVGPTGEIPASPATAAKLARRLVEHRVNAVIDLSGLQLAEKQLFVKNFLDALLTLPRELWSRTVVVIDEAHKFASTEQSNVVSATSVISLMDQGRKRRLCGVLATQRLSKLLASARAEANNLFIGRTAQDLDLKRAVDLLGLEKRDWALLKSAKPGDFFGYGPAFLHQDGVLRFRTKPVVTTHEDDERAPAKTPRPSSSILRVVAEFEDLQQEVDRERDELTRLREENTRLRSQAAKTPAAAPKAMSDTERNAVHAAALKKGWDEGAAAGFDKGWSAACVRVAKVLAPLRDDLTKVMSAMTLKLESLAGEAQKHMAAPPLPAQPKPTPAAPVRVVAPVPAKAAPAKAAAPRHEAAEGDTLGKGAAYKLIVVLVQHGERMPRARAAFLAGIKPTTGTFRNALSTLRIDGLMTDLENGDIEATDLAKERYADAAPMLEPDTLLDFWRRKFGDGAVGKLFSVLVDARGPISRDEAAARAGIKPTTGTFRNALSTLRVAGVMEDVGKDIQLSHYLKYVGQLPSTISASMVSTTITSASPTNTRF